MNKSSISEKFAVINFQQLEWVRNQHGSVKDLWFDCWMSDCFGSRYERLITTIDTNSSTFRKAKKILRDAGYFEFQEITELTKSGQRKIVGWKTRNLHGSRSRKPKHSHSTPINPAKYRKHLKSDYWCSVRADVLTRDKNTCQHCGSRRNLQIHHLTYEHVYQEKEYLQDLLTLCEDCHKTEHKLT